MLPATGPQTWTALSLAMLLLAVAVTNTVLPAMRLRIGANCCATEEGNVSPLIITGSTTGHGKDEGIVQNAVAETKKTSQLQPHPLRVARERVEMHGIVALHDEAAIAAYVYVPGQRTLDGG